MPHSTLVFLRGWPTLAWRGALATGFGLALLLWFHAPTRDLAWLFAAFALVDGLGSIATITRRASHPSAWLLGLEGVIGVCFGVGMAVLHDFTPVRLAQIVGLWAVATGSCQVSLLLAAIVRRRETVGTLVLAMAGGVLTAMGLALMAWPDATGRTLAPVLGSYEFVAGLSTLSLTITGFRSHPRRPA
jgi:uncharacterized membrane protein HdeD (DUF308 family)